MDKQSKPKVSQDVEVEITSYRSDAFKARIYTRPLLQASGIREYCRGVQQQVTCFDGEDDNDYSIVKPDRDNADHGATVVDGMLIRMVVDDNASHRIVAHVVGGDQHEVSCYKE